MSVSKGKIEYLDVLNVIAMFAVVMLHANGCFWTYSTDRYWFEANIIESVMYFGVPVFFMISGATLLDYRERYSTKDFFIKRIKKTVIPFLFWSLFGIFFNIVRGSLDASEVTWQYVVKGISSTSIVAVYWFFIPLFCVYLSIPLFAAIPKENKKSIFAYMVAIAIFFNSLVPFLAYFFEWMPYNGSMKIDASSGYIIYLLLGYILSNIDIKFVFRVIIYVLGLVGLGIHAIGTYKLSNRYGGINRDFKGYMSVQCIIYSVSIFLLIKYLSPYILKSKIIKSIIDFVKKYTFGIYLLHWFVMTAINRIFNLDIYSLKYRLIMPFIIIAVCILIIAIIRKIPIIKHVVP